MQITVQLGSLLGDMKDRLHGSLAACKEQMLQDCNYYCLQDQGTLMASAIASFGGKDAGEITWNTPYARRRYYEGTPRRGINPNASLHWAEKAAQQFGDDWADQIAKGASMK